MWQHLESIIVFMTMAIKDGERELLQIRKTQRPLVAHGVRKKMLRAHKCASLLALKRMLFGGTNDFKHLQTRSPAISFPSTENQYLEGLNMTAVRKRGPEISLKSMDTLLQAFKQSVSRWVMILSRSSLGSISIDVRTCFQGEQKD